MAEIAPPTTVGIVIFDGVEELDFVGPWEVFSMARQIGAPLDVFTVGWPKPAIRCDKGLYVVADHAFDKAPKTDVVLIPGGKGTRALAQDETFIAALKPYLAQATWQTSVCTGAALLGKAGVLDGKHATTNRNAFDFFRASAPRAVLEEQLRYVRDGHVLTGAGVSAGIDMALWLVGHLFGDDVARSTQTFMEYFPEPPYGNAS